MFSTPTSSKRQHEEMSKSPTVTSPARKKNYTETTTAIGVACFKILIIKSSIFIDKSLLIKEFLKNPAETLLITCPRRWGKSININMIKTFLEIEVNEEGKKHSDKTKTGNYKLFVEGKIDLGNSKIDSLESKLLITQHDDIIDNYLGEYPVISVDFKNVIGKNFQEILSQLKSCLNQVFNQHRYLLKSSILEEDYLISLKKYIMKDEFKNLDIEDIKLGIQFLCESLYKHFGRKVFILMDEYDTPINNILQSTEFSEHDLENTLMLFRIIMTTAFKGNEYLEKGLITGVFRIAKSSLFSGLNNILEYSFLKNPLAKYYGFTEDDIGYLFDEYKISKENRDRAVSWYDGYIVRTDPATKLFNPWSILNFLHFKKIENYWEETGNIDFIRELFKIDAIKTRILSLLCQTDINDQESDQTYAILENLKFSKENFFTLKELLNKGDNYQINEEIIDLFFRYIFAAGYLTMTEEQEFGSINTRIKIPNKEVRSELEKKLVIYYKKLYSIDTKLFKTVTDELIKIFENQNTNKLAQSLEKLFAAFPQFIDIKEDIQERGVHGNEDLVHSVINYVALQIRDLSKFGTEVWYQKKGRADIILIDERRKSGMIIELKYTDSAEKALFQTQKYLPLFKKYNEITTINSLGINVSKNKKVNIESKFEVNPYYSAQEQL